MGMSSMPQMQEQMRQHMDTMQALRAKMAAATTPAERQALMAEHTKAMQDGMDMMKGMRSMGGMSGMGSQGAASIDQPQRQQMMEMRMDMMQNMMEMMMQRMPSSSGDATTK
jgi:predicted urease superfamily metal-dependent hydrolase